MITVRLHFRAFPIVSSRKISRLHSTRAGGLSVSCDASVFYANLLALFLASPFSITYSVLADEASDPWKRHHRGSGSLSPSSSGPQPIRALTIRPSTGEFLYPDPNGASKRRALFNAKSRIPLGPGSVNILDAPNLLMPPQVPPIDLNQPLAYQHFHIASAFDNSLYAGRHTHPRYPFLTRYNSLLSPYMFHLGFINSRGHKFSQPIGRGQF